MSEHIVIVGGGFAGWYAARSLAPRLRSGHSITLVDRVDHMLYTPMLTEVAGGNLAAESIAVPMADLPRRVRLLKAEVLEIDVAQKRVTLSGGETLHATQLVIALGSTTAYHHVQGAKEYGLPLKTLEDAQRLLGRINQNVERAVAEPDAATRRELLTMVVAGGGYTGVETIAAIAEHVQHSVEKRGLAAKEVSAVVVEPTERLMQETPTSLALYSQQLLERQGVRVVLNTEVKTVSEDGVTLGTGEEIKSGVTVWDAGIEPSPLLKTTQLPLGKHGGVTVDACFRVASVAGVWAIGDCAEIPQSGGKTYAPTAQNATREGVHLAQNISAVLRGDSPRPFRFKMLGQLALLSDRKAVAEILGLKIWGTLAWAMWWVIYTAKLPSAKGRLAVVRRRLE